jgi:hypothetical protein
MKSILLLLTTLILFSYTLHRQQPAFQQLHTLAGGTWVMKTKKGFLCERWEKKDANTLHNQSYRVAGTDTSLLERVELIQQGNTITYNSMVMDQNGSKTIPFKLVEAKDGQFIFANPEHDFPQRIIYHLVSQDSLHAWIDGKMNGKEGRSDFYYKRQK